MPSMEEVNEALFFITQDNSQRPNGFGRFSIFNVGMLIVLMLLT